MKSGVVIFPGSNRERDMLRALEIITGTKPVPVWHADTELPDLDLVVLCGGFSYGDYLRTGAIAARGRIMPAIASAANKGVRVLGICNGFQILCEAGLLPGVLMRNAGLKFVCKNVKLETVNADTDFTRKYAQGEIWPCPVAHGDGNYFTDPDTLNRLEGEGRVALRYADGTNPNGSLNDIAGILNARGNVFGMMPHPENMIEPLNGATDGRALFESVLEAVA
ncbi:MAG: phosphoribosylformylglycinamidine synthase subunit PurQ [Alphaproteobacteria bacterium HGW-Alphaproteobacteria-12]|nr:MAG: phosphoribosylformylglycinamidine synthase subunit PurQ [Alphaproteobacteria bacterium HGW-Alphaproteobacteria-12]